MVLGRDTPPSLFSEPGNFLQNRSHHHGSGELAVISQDIVTIPFEQDVQMDFEPGLILNIPAIDCDLALRFTPAQNLTQRSSSLLCPGVGHHGPAKWNAAARDQHEPFRS